MVETYKKRHIRNERLDISTFKAYLERLRYLWNYLPVLGEHMRNTTAISPPTIGPIRYNQ